MDFESRPGSSKAAGRSHQRAGTVLPPAHEICEVASDDYDPERATAELEHPRAKLLLSIRLGSRPPSIV